ncbi:hypothetical protein ESZ50_06090 [Weissella muntiaci]|uniref:LPXTG cell wall anchor domain-containing protein n=1 Tax=Weissella muntiaci TaxID=2508881 RepID=A0A6C2C6W9_9LACO|nr:KxYKxGKxW signal peptide domain-containing protein [Weissella muntiaci]TYC49700.1 hypothetical protein ESZ50_06090 [Weissella muntiaci]
MDTGKTHYKMYKDGKAWVYAGLATTAMLAGLMLGNIQQSASADVVTVPAVASVSSSATAEPVVASSSAVTSSVAATSSLAVSSSSASSASVATSSITPSSSVVSSAVSTSSPAVATPVAERMARMAVATPAVTSTTTTTVADGDYVTNAANYEATAKASSTKQTNPAVPYTNTFTSPDVTTGLATTDAVVTNGYAQVYTWAGLEDVYADNSISYIDLMGDLSAPSTAMSNDLGYRGSSLIVNANGHTVNMGYSAFNTGATGTTIQAGSTNVPGVGTTMTATASNQYFALINGTFQQWSTSFPDNNSDNNAANTWSHGLVEGTMRNSGANWNYYINNVTLTGNPAVVNSTNATDYANRLVNAEGSAIVLSGTINATDVREPVVGGAIYIANGAKLTLTRPSGIADYADSFFYFDNWDVNNGANATAANTTTGTYANEAAITGVEPVTVGGQTLTATQAAQSFIVGDGATVNIQNDASSNAYPSVYSDVNNYYLGDNVTWTQTNTQKILDTSVSITNMDVPVGATRVIQIGKNLTLSATGLQYAAFTLGGSSNITGSIANGATMNLTSNNSLINVMAGSALTIDAPRDTEFALVDTTNNPIAGNVVTGSGQLVITNATTASWNGTTSKAAGDTPLDVQQYKNLTYNAGVVTMDGVSSDLLANGVRQVALGYPAPTITAQPVTIMVGGTVPAATVSDQSASIDGGSTTVTGAADTATPGVYDVTYTYNYTDMTTGKPASVATTQTVTVLAIPTIAAPADAAVVVNGAYSAGTATVANQIAGGTTAVDSSAVDTAVLGTYPVVYTYAYTDPVSGQVMTIKATQTVTIFAEPTITAPADVSIPSNGTYNAGVATVANEVSGGTGTVDSSAVNTAVAGTYPVVYTYAYTDPTSGQMTTIKATQTVTVFVAPTIVAPANVAVVLNSVYNAGSATIANTITGGTTAVDSSAVNMAVAGAYPVVYTYTYVNPADGQTKTITATQTVTVFAEPTITAPASIAVDLNGSYTAGVATIANEVAGGTSTVDSSVVNTAVAGTYPVVYTYAYIDPASGQAETIKATQLVVVATLPKITAPANISVTLNGNYTTGNAVVTNESKDGSIKIDTSALNTTLAGTYPVVYSYTYTDPASGQATTITATQLVTVFAAPTITAPANVAISLNAKYTAGVATVVDAVAGGTSTVDSSAVNVAVAGIYPVIYTYTYADPVSGQMASVTATQMVTIFATPTITAPANITISVGGTFSDGTAVITNEVAGGKLSVDRSALNTSLAGTYPVIYAYTYTDPTDGKVITISSVQKVTVVAAPAEAPKVVAPIIKQSVQKEANILPVTGLTGNATWEALIGISASTAAVLLFAGRRKRDENN